MNRWLPDFAKTANLPAEATLFFARLQFENSGPVLVGLIFSRLGRILAHLAPILDRLGHLCWPILSDLGPSRLHLGAIFVPSRLHLGAIFVPSWPTSAPSRPHLGPVLPNLGPVFVIPRSFPSAAFVQSISVQLPVQLQLVGGGAAAPPAPPHFRSGFCPGRQGKRGRVFSSSRLSVTIAPELYNLTQQILLHSQTLFADLFPFFLVVTFFSDTKIKSPVRTVPRLCR